MKLPIAWILGAAVLVAGCNDTQNSLQKDTEQNAEKASGAVKDAMEPLGDAAENAAAATTLTPRLKSAITADKELNDGRNHINIDSDKDRVTIDGHVVSDALKAKAESIVREEMKKAGAKQEVVNNLMVKASEGS